MEELIGYGILLLVVLGVSVGVEQYTCTSKAAVMKKSVSWGPIQGCMIETKDGFVPIEQLRVLQ